jgi:hypothetical protein
MALSENAQTLLEALDSGGRAANPATLRRRLGWSEEQLDSAADEVCQAGLAEKQGSRLARVISGAGVSPEAEMLLAALPADGWWEVYGCARRSTSTTTPSRRPSRS